MRRGPILCSAMIVAFVLSACASGPTFGVDAGAATASVLRGDTTTRTVTVARGGVVGPIVLALSGAPAGVTATFADPVLPDGATSTTLTLSVAPSAVDGASSLTVTAVAGARAASTTVALTVESLTVSGRIVDALGLPRGGVSIGVQGVTTASASDGTFEVSGLSVPYDVATVVAGPNPVAHVFTGLRAEEVELFPYGTIFELSPVDTTVAGALPAAVPVGHRVAVCVEGLTTPLYGCTTVSQGETTYEVLAYYGGGAVGARVHALLYEADANGRPVAYASYGTADTTVASGATSSGVDIVATTDPADTSIALSANVPAGFTPSQVTLGVRLNERFTLSIGYVSLPAGALGTFPMPVLPGATYGATVGATAVGGGDTIGWRLGLSANASVTIDLPAPPVQQAPADGATGIGVGSTLTLASAPSGAKTFVVSPAAFGPGSTLAITTVEDQVTIPDLTSLGFALLPATEQTWAVVVAPGAATPESAGVGWYRAYADVTLALTQGGPSLLDAPTGAIMATGSRTYFTP